MAKPLCGGEAHVTIGDCGHTNVTVAVVPPARVVDSLVSAVRFDRHEIRLVEVLPVTTVHGPIHRIPPSAVARSVAKSAQGQSSGGSGTEAAGRVLPESSRD